MKGYAIGILKEVQLGPQIVEYLERIDVTLAPWVHPLMLGEGRRPFPVGVRETELGLVDAAMLKNGMVVLELRRAGR